ncbi:MAG: DEAD/DEAH box helicase, partial [Alphaproteobacteria bacterium]
MTDIFTPQQQLISHAHQNFLANRKEKIYLQTSLALANAGLLANLAQAEKNLLVVCRNQQDMVLKKQLLLFHHPDAIIFSYPPFDNNVDIIHQRINCLFALLQTSKTIIVITCYQALLPALPPPDVFLSQPIEITSGQTYQMTELLKKLLLLGYNQTSEVRRLGDMVRHGGIIDIFAITPSPHHFPIRIDFFGEQIDNIYYFSPLDQRRLKQFGNIEKIKILPISEIPLDDESKKNFLFHLREELLLSLPADGFEISQLSKYDLEYYQPLFFKQTCHFFDYVKKNFILFFHGISVDNIAQHYNLAESHYQDKCEEYKNQLRQTKKSPSHHGVMLPPLPPKKFLLSPDRWQKKIKQYFCLTEQKNDMPSQPINSPEKISTIELMAKPLSLDWQRLMVMHDENDAPSLQEKLLALIKKSPTSILVAAHNIASLHRWQKLLQGDDLPPVVVVETAEKNFSQLLSDQQKKIMLAVLPLQHGEEWQNLTIITDHDIFQVEFQWSPPDDKKINKTKINKLIKDITTLKKNDLITHLDYGIGQFLGLKPITAGDRVHDCVALVYRGGDKLYLPIENLDRLQRYGDLPDPPPSLDNILDKLGSSDWQARVAKTRQRIKQLAQKLAKNAALRQTIKADPLCPADSDYLEFASLFPYPETRDQEQAILAVKNDLAKNKPMDRLICGDVGFGKTEVALRASFCAVMANKQVLVITPTTLLARQHYHHFIKRFKNFATRIKQMSRLVSPPTAKKIKQDINQGTVDIVIGTHGLLHPSIAPHNLG